MLIDKLVAVARRDLLTTVRYRGGLLVHIAGMLADIAGAYFLARAIGSGFRPDGVDYFSFLLVGTGVAQMLLVAISTFVHAIQEAQVTGTMEVLMTTSTRPFVIVLLGATSAFMGRVVSLALYLSVGVFVFRAPVQHPNLLTFLIVLVLAIATSVALGIFAAAVQIILQKGSAVVWLFGSVVWLFSGVMFPIDVLPQPFRAVAEAIPVTHAMKGLRMALFRGASLTDVAGPVLVLCGFTFVLVPASLWAFSAALNHGRRAGTLSFY